MNVGVYGIQGNTHIPMDLIKSVVVGGQWRRIAEE